MNETALFFLSKGEYFAAGFFEEPERSKFYRFSRAYQRFWENMTMPAYRGGTLYPCGWKWPDNMAVMPDYSFTFSVNYGKLAETCGESARQLIRQEMDVIQKPATPHAVGGYCYTHSIPNFGRIEQEGLVSYRSRVEQLEASDFRDGLLCLLNGIETYHRRALELLQRENAPEQLIAALRKVPFAPAETLYEAVVCRNFIYYVDGCDNPGRLDADWIQYYQGEDIMPLLEEFFDNVDTNNGWTAALGPDYNELTVQILKAIKGYRRPSMELRVTPDMPDEIWTAAAEALQGGGGSPSLYNEELFQDGLQKTFPNIDPVDLKKFCGGGCTETMLAGISRVGSLDAGINTALVFSQVMRSRLAAADTFEQFYEDLFAALKETVADTLEKVTYIYRQRALEVPQPVRTLLIDDCIDKGLDYNAGGARVNWSVINFAGMVNVIDSLLAIRELIYEKQEYTANELITLLDAEDEHLYIRLRQCPCFGVDNAAVDTLASDFSSRLFALLDAHTPYLGGKYLASSIQFVTYTDAGRHVPATPDGRKAGDPLCDSVGAIHGKDKQGPTALLNSVSKLALSQAVGTPVLNLRMQKKHIAQSLKPLIQTFFANGGMQAQITCVSREDLEDAMLHPDLHENLIVRVGGYSEYFNRLSPALKQTVLERTEY